MTSPLSPHEILKKVEKEGFERIWRESSNFIQRSSKRLDLSSGRRGKPHPIYELIQKLRNRFLSLGFDEIFNPVIVDENEIYRQYGPEAPIILDRCYYLAALPRPDIGLSRAKCREIERLGVKLTDFKILVLKRILRNYKKGKIDSDDLIEEIAKALDVSDDIATGVVSQVFPEFSSLKPISSKLTLRSHMTSSWFLTLQALQHMTDLPLKLFSIDIRFRREQREDPTHLRVHHSASCVVMDEELNIEDGERITRALLEPLGLKNFRFVRRKVTSKYYAYGMEYEGFAYNPFSGEWIEIVDYGIYNPISLAKYGLEHPVLNVGLGVERLAMILYGESDVRRLVYPQFYKELFLTDREIAESLRFREEPSTKEGWRIRDTIIREALKHKDSIGPCQFLIYDGKILGKRVKIYIYEDEEGASLLGAAAENCIFVYDGNIIGAPLKGMNDSPLVRKAREKGFCTGIKYLDGVASYAVAKIEEALRKGLKVADIRIKMVKRLSDVNLELSGTARRFITGQKKRIMVTGPIFLGIRAEISK